MKLDYILTLVSDGEPGTGLGGDLVDDFVPRDTAGRPLLRASHVRGLVRERMAEIGSVIGRPDLDDVLLGRDGMGLDDEGIAA